MVSCKVNPKPFGMTHDLPDECQAGSGPRRASSGEIRIYPCSDDSCTPPSPPRSGGACNHQNENQRTRHRSAPNPQPYCQKYNQANLLKNEEEKVSTEQDEKEEKYSSKCKFIIGSDNTSEDRSDVTEEASTSQSERSSKSFDCSSTSTERIVDDDGSSQYLINKQDKDLLISPSQDGSSVPLFSNEHFNKVPNGNYDPLTNHVNENGNCSEQFQILLRDPCNPEDPEDTLTSKVKRKLSPSNIQCNGYDLRLYFALGILFVTNLLNYMDRYTIAGVLVKVTDFYSISKGDAGLLQTSFICSYMILSPIFGYLGDRYSRKIIMACGIFFWSIITLASSFVPGDKYWLFLLMRALVGVGEASYSTIAPTIIADLFFGTTRTKALSVFYFAIPVGSGLGYIVGSKVAELFGHWQWALRVTPAFGIVCSVLLLLVVKDPPRGAADGGTHIHSTSWGADLKYLVRHKSFMLSSLGFTCVAFVAGAMALWAPTYMLYSMQLNSGGQEVDESLVSMIFGIVTCGAGFLGVGLGTYVAHKLRARTARADPLVCAFGLMTSAPFLYLALWLSQRYIIATWVLIFIGETLLSLNWALVTDILLYIVIPTRRSTAEALQILMSHAFGDAGSPYIIGFAADMLSNIYAPHRGKLPADYLSLQYAMYVPCFVCVLGGGFFLATALFVEEDRKHALQIVQGTITISRENSTDEVATLRTNATDQSLPVSMSGASVRTASTVVA